jgi:hypothetical protein
MLRGKDLIDMTVSTPTNPTAVETGERASTPRPWSLGAQVLHQGVLSRNVFSEVAGGMWGGGYIGIFTEADAELIVTAVNSHAELERERDALREALQSIRQCAHGIMPIYGDMDQLKEIIIKADDARWTRLYAILAEARAALGETKSA